MIFASPTPTYIYTCIIYGINVLVQVGGFLSHPLLLFN